MYQSLQAGRATAAVLVVLFHLGGTFAQDKYFGFKALDGPFSWADAGVDFFFVLSGFLITITHRKDFGHPQALGPYLFKRTLRIYPTYWLICLAVCLAALAVPSLRQSLPADALTLLKGLALIPQDPAVVGGTGSPILFVAWSLQYEMLFYIVVAVFIASRMAGLLVAAGLLLVYASCHLSVLSGSTTCGFPQSFFSANLILLFGLGVASAYIVQSRFRLPAPLFVAIAAVLAFFSFGTFEAFNGREILPVDRRLIYGAIASVMIIALTQAEDRKELVLKQRWIALLGDASYSLYLLHIPIISVLCKLFLSMHVSGHMTLVAVFIFTFLVCVGIALGFHLLIERRMLGLFRHKSGVKSRKQEPGIMNTHGATTLPGGLDHHLAGTPSEGHRKVQW